MYNFTILLYLPSISYLSLSICLCLRVRPLNPRGLEGIVLPSTHPLLKSSPHPICWVVCPSTDQPTYIHTISEGTWNRFKCMYLLMYHLVT